MLIKSLLYDAPSSEYLEYGKRHEPDAIAAYEQYKKLENGTVNKVGIILSEERPGYGTSLDGMVTFNGVTGGIECKCPASKEGKTIQEACSDPNFCLQCDENGNAKLKSNPNKKTPDKILTPSPPPPQKKISQFFGTS